METISLSATKNAVSRKGIRAFESFVGYFPEKQSNIDILEGKLGYIFSNKGLLVEALTHRSAVVEFEAFMRKLDHPSDTSIHWNERLEFLGDSVLGLTVTSMIWGLSEKFDEGQMSKMRSSIVSEASLAEIARKIDIGPHIYLGRGETLSKGFDRDSLLADALEALFGAVYLDGGVQKAMALIEQHLKEQTIRSEQKSRDYKTIFQEIVQQKEQKTPTYRLIAQSGPDHKKTFEVGAYVGEKLITKGTGSNKRLASQEAARLALLTLKD